MRAEKYWAIFQTQAANRMAYAGDLVAHSLTIVMFMWIFMQLWRTTYVSSGSDTLAGLTLHHTLWYLMLAEVIMLSKPRLSRGISQAVKDGSIAYLLNKPYDFLLYQLSLGLGDSLLNTLFNLLAGGATVWLLVGPPPAIWGWPLAIAAMVLAWLIDFCVNALIGLAAFATEEVSAFEWIYSKFLLLLGGVLIPLDFFPGWLQKITNALPFAYTIYGPARLFIEPSLDRFVSLVGVQILWILLLGSLVILVYHKGLSRLAVNGG